MVDVEKEMMKEIMADYHSGDPRKVASAKEQILNKAQRLITFMIKKYFPTYIPRYYDELYQECMVALYDAIPKFNPERATLSTYLTKPLHRAMSAYIHSLTNRSNSYYGKQIPLSFAFFMASIAAIPLSTVIINPLSDSSMIFLDKP